MISCYDESDLKLMQLEIICKMLLNILNPYDCDTQSIVE